MICCVHVCEACQARCGATGTVVGTELRAVRKGCSETCGGWALDNDEVELPCQRLHLQCIIMHLHAHCCKKTRILLAPGRCLAFACSIMQTCQNRPDIHDTTPGAQRSVPEVEQVKGFVSLRALVHHAISAVACSCMLSLYSHGNMSTSSLSSSH
eukprot:366569-Chlamydomonas_euryale.AAC.16